MKPSDNPFDVVIAAYTKKYAMPFPEYNEWREFIKEASQYVSGSNELQVLPKLKELRDALYAFLYENELSGCVKEMITGTRKVITYGEANSLYSKGLGLWTHYESEITEAVGANKCLEQLEELRREYLAKITEAPCVDGGPTEGGSKSMDDTPF